MNEGMKIRIEGFIEYLSKDEPFNGDEVTEISRYFVTELCKQNAEEDQINCILKDAFEGGIYLGILPRELF